MSSYLLLRNNKESGPFTLEELQGMPLKSYDLLWVVGKSAAWRYPGEIAELKSFAPPVPNPVSDLYSRKTTSKKTDQEHPEQKPTPGNITETNRFKTTETNGHRFPTVHSVYVNLPAEKKMNTKHPDRILFEPDLDRMQIADPSYDFSNLYKRQSSNAARYSGKILLFSTILLLFGAGILTGFFISDRRKFFSTGDNTTHQVERIRPGVPVNQKEISSSAVTTGSPVNLGKTEVKESPSAAAGIIPPNQPNMKMKKAVRPGVAKKDTVAAAPAQELSASLIDSLKQVNISKSDILIQRIKAHPENYITLETGRYSTGVFGGISSFPVTLTNNSPVMLDLVAVSVDYIQNNGKIFKTEILSFNDLQPGETATLKAPKSPRGVKIATSMHLMGSPQTNLSSSN